MKRNYETTFLNHLADFRQMVFVMGPRQSGKTTVAQQLINQNKFAKYFSWDNTHDRDLILQGTDAIARESGIANTLIDEPPILCFDEIHKYAHWRDLLKGLYDSYPEKARIMAMGSANLDVFSRGGDSLMGRYFPFHFHPLSVAELTQESFPTSDSNLMEPKKIDDNSFDALWKFGGYPDPLIKQSETFHRRWQKLRMQQLLHEDIRDLSRVQDIDRLQMLAQYMQHNAAHQITYTKLSKHLRVSDKTIREWLILLKSIYYCFDLKPYSQNVARSLLKEPKYYLWDWSLCQDDGARAENFIAMALLKAVNYWNDMGFADYELCYLRDKDKHEVDFIIIKNNKPWAIIEAKLNNQSSLSPNLHYFQKQLNANFALQVVINKDYVDKNCFISPDPIIVPAKTFLSQLI